MTLTANEKTVTFVYKTRLVQQFEERMKVENVQQFWTRAMQEENIKILATALLVFSDKAIKTLDEAQDFIDAYLDGTSDGSIQALYADLIEDINAKGFFGQRMEREALLNKLNAPVMDMNTIFEKVADELAGELLLQARGQA